MGDDGRTAWGQEGELVSTLSTKANSLGWGRLAAPSTGISYILTSAPERFSRVWGLQQVVMQHKLDEFLFIRGHTITNLVYGNSE
jgi:hypothetical protein